MSSEVKIIVELFKSDYSLSNYWFRWNVTEFGICSKGCGGGVQVRDVQCVHEVTRGTANTIIVPNHQCYEPVPRYKQYCNVFDCPPQWKTEPWTKVSKLFYINR